MNRIAEKSEAVPKYRKTFSNLLEHKEMSKKANALLGHLQDFTVSWNDEDADEDQDEALHYENNNRNDTLNNASSSQDEGDDADNSTLRHPCYPFLKLPSRKELPDYYEVISKPMNFVKLRNKLKNHSYNDFSQFVPDVKLMFANARKYTCDDSLIFKDSIVLGEEFMKLKDSF